MKTTIVKTPGSASKAAAARILNVKPSQIKEVRVLESKNVVLVVGKGWATFVSFNAFSLDFVALRVRGAESVKVWPMAEYDLNCLGLYDAKTEGSDQWHIVTHRSYDGMPSRCSCEDWVRHSEANNSHRCKHIIAVDNWIRNLSQSRVFAHA
jgi:hypothetical protein